LTFYAVFSSEKLIFILKLQILRQTVLILLTSLALSCPLAAQNSMVGDGFGGRLWYKPHNFNAASYAGFALCGDDNQLYAWGYNKGGVFGSNTVDSSWTPIKIPGMTDVEYFSSGYVSAAVKEDKSAWYWSAVDGYTPKKILDDAYFLDANVYSATIVKTDGTVWSYGQETSENFGDGDGPYVVSPVPVQMENISNAVRVAAGFHATFCLTSEKRVYACGYNRNLGINNSLGFTTKPVEVPIDRIVDIKASTQGCIALGEEGQVWQWGQIGQQWFYNPVPVPTLNNIVAISSCVDGFHFMALDSSGNCYAWGENYKGAFGHILDYDYVHSPVLIATDVIDIMAGEIFSYILKPDKSLWAVGGTGVGNKPEYYMFLLDRFNDFSGIGTGDFVQLHPEKVGIDLCEPCVAGAPGETGPEILHPPTLVCFPNAFTPNGDDNNDYFRPLIKAGAEISNYSLCVYNRSGNRVFYSRDPQEGWDGKFKSEDQDMNVFFYRCDYDQGIFRKQHLQGELILMR